LQLSSWYGVRADVVNRGHSGYNTRIAMELLEQRKEGWYHPMDSDRAAELVVIFWGANDAATGGIQGLSVNEYKERLSQQIQQVQTAGKQYSKRVSGIEDEKYTKVILIAPPPVDDEAWLQEVKEKFQLNNPEATEEEINNLPLDRNFKTTGSYAEAAKEVALSADIPFIDLYNDMQTNLPSNSGSYGVYLCDGLHFSPEGNDFLFKALLKTISKNYQSLIPTNIPKDFLEWRDAIAESNKKRNE